MRTTWGHQHHHPLNFKFGELWWCATVECYLGWRGALLVHRPPKKFPAIRHPGGLKKKTINRLDHKCFHQASQVWDSGVWFGLEFDDGGPPPVHHPSNNFRVGELWWCATVECYLGWRGALLVHRPPKIISSNQAPRRFNKGRQELGWITNAFTRLHKCGILGCDTGSNLMMGGPTPVHHPSNNFRFG